MWLSFGDVQHILCVSDNEAMFLWDAFANSGIDMMNRNEMFVAICMYAGCNIAEKGRFILTLFDTGMRGLISLNELHHLIFTVLEVLGNAAQVVVKKKDIYVALESFIVDVIELRIPEYAQ